jgi:hypothetical protein
LVCDLAPDHNQRHALAGHLDGVRVTEPVWYEAPAHARSGGGVAQLSAGGAG